MGGGGAMRAAAKVAGVGVGVVNGGLRGSLVSALQPAEQSVRNAPRPFSAVISSPTKGGEVAAAAAIERPSWEMIDDWEFAGGDHEFDSSEPMARVVFGGAPSLEEAKAATDELKDALEKEYLSSPKSIASGGSFGVGQVSGLTLLSNSECLETKTCTTSYHRAAPVPTHVMTAFTLLSESPAAQSVVASIASDPNVWNAVLKNDALMEFLQSHPTSAPCPDMNLSSKESVGDSDLDLDSSKKFDESDASQFGNSGDGLMEILQNIKLTVVDIVHNVSGFIQNIFGFSASENVSTDANGNSSSIPVDRTVGVSFMALAVMVIVVVLLKRG